MNDRIGKKVAIYVRVSTSKQELDNQLLQLREYCKKSHWVIFKEYPDIITGKEESRPWWDLLFEDAHRKKFDVVIFWDLSRFSRSGTLYTLQKLKELENLNIGYISYCEPYLNTVGQFKDVVISILSTIAKIEREQKSLRTKAGLNRVKKKGVILGRPSLPRETIFSVEKLLHEGASYHNIRQQVEYRNKKGRLSHISIGKISAIKKNLSKKEGGISA
jgi:DNA invertase Pin-like site-specific DNA recombinase